MYAYTRMLNSFKKIHWTEHSKAKMRQYGLSKIKLLQLIRKPERKEKGIAQGTTAVMQTNKSFSKVKKPSGETWLMYLDDPSTSAGQVTIKIISAWRYPGVSKPGESIPIPEDIRREILEGND